VQSLAQVLVYEKVMLKQPLLRWKLAPLLVTWPSLYANLNTNLIEWAKNPAWTDTLIAYLCDNPDFCIKLFSDSMAAMTKAG
jgi:hypothetical protein